MNVVIKIVNLPSEVCSMQLAWFGGDLCVENKIRHLPFNPQFHVLNFVVMYHIHIGINGGVCVAGMRCSFSFCLLTCQRQQSLPSLH
jgi:hypothetical protein